MSLYKRLLSCKWIISIFTMLLLIILFIFPTSSLEGAKKGLLLWFNIILPTLLPFIIVSNLIIQLHLTVYFSKLFYRFFHFIFGVTNEACYPIILGMLTGLPLGAKACADLTKSRRISCMEGQYLLCFCNNASPVFIISYIAISSLNIPHMQYILLLIIYAASIATAFTYRILHSNTPESTSITTEEITGHTQVKKITFSTIDQSILDSFEVVTKVGGYIILFSILANVFLDISNSDPIISNLIVGILEITNGVNSISALTLALNTKIILIITMTAFGGLSSIAQTKSVIDQSGLSIKIYLRYKLVNAMYAFLFISLYLYLI